MSNATPQATDPQASPPLAPLIDTHAHTSDAAFDADRAAVIERAQAAGVGAVIEIGYNFATSHAAVALAAHYPGYVFAVVGIQPNHCNDLPADWLQQVGDLAQQPGVVAVGEIGLDFYWNVAPLAQQEDVFRQQLALARELALPVVIHSRDAQADTVRVLRDAARGQPGIMHSFLGDTAYAEACLDIGFLVSFSGPVTFRKATDLHAAAQVVPPHMLLTETDSPYLTPHPHRGKRNEPAHVALVAAQLATLRAVPLATLRQQVWDNARRVFGVPR